MLGKKIPSVVERMTKSTHFIIIGKEKISLHLAGIPRIKADEVVLFNPSSKKVEKIINAIRDLSVEYRIIPVKPGYFDSYTKATSEAAATFTDDSVIAVNISTGPRIVQLAIEDAVRIQHFYYDKRTFRTTRCSAFRYVVKPGRKQKILIAPLWDFYKEDFNNIFEVLTTTKKPLSIREIYEFLANIDPQIGGYEAFRKTFRDFKRAFQNLPCFQEEIGKTPRYWIDL